VRFPDKVLLLPALFLMALVLADGSRSTTGGVWENGAGIHKITVEVELSTVSNGDIDVKMNGETITLKGGWNTDSSTGKFNDGTEVRVRCDGTGCWLEIRRAGGIFVRMTWIRDLPPKPKPIDGSVNYDERICYVL
jgi:hypothetical protein